MALGSVQHPYHGHDYTFNPGASATWWHSRYKDTLVRVRNENCFGWYPKDYANPPYDDDSELSLTINPFTDLPGEFGKVEVRDKSIFYPDGGTIYGDYSGVQIEVFDEGSVKFVGGSNYSWFDGLFDIPQPAVPTEFPFVGMPFTMTVTHTLLGEDIDYTVLLRNPNARYWIMDY